MGKVARHLAQVLGWMPPGLDKVVLWVCQCFLPPDVEACACSINITIFPPISAHDRIASVNAVLLLLFPVGNWFDFMTLVASSFILFPSHSRHRAFQTLREKQNSPLGIRALMPTAILHHCKENTDLP